MGEDRIDNDIQENEDNAQEENLEDIVKELENKFGDLEKDIETKLDGLTSKIEGVEKMVDEIIKEFGNENES